MVEGCDSTAKSPNHDEAKPVPFLQLLAFADCFDALLMSLGSLGAIASGIAMPIYLLFLKRFLDAFGSHKAISSGAITENCLSLVYLGLISWAAAWIEVLCWTVTGERQMLTMRRKYLQTILQQDIGKFDTSLQTGHIIENISNDMLIIENAVGEKMGNAIHFLSTSFAGLVLGFTTTWQLALITLGIVPLIAVVAGIQAYFVTTFSSQSQEAYGKAGVIAEEAIAQVRTVYSYVAEEKTLQSFSNALEVARQACVKVGLFNGAGTSVTYLVNYGAFGILQWLSSVLYIHKIVSGGSIFITLVLILVGAISLGQASLSFSAFSQARAAAAKIYPLIEASSTLKGQLLSAKKLSVVEGEITFRNVDFAYPSRPDVTILHNFDLLIQKGQRVAIVGSSGSGKSTLIMLLERFYEPSSGCVLLDGNDIRSLDLKWLRSQLALVSQEPVLFAASIMENILLGKEDATSQEVEDAVKFAHVDDFLQKLPHGYNTQVGEKGIQLSGGQKQRIALARAALKNAPVLLLDEATSALDSSSEKLIQTSLDELMISRTGIVIAHRLSTIQDVDRIVVLEKGKLIESGTHAELMSKGASGSYYKLVKLQETNCIDKPTSSKPSHQSSGSGTPTVTPHRRSIQSPSFSQGLGMLDASARISADLDSHCIDSVTDWIPQEAPALENGNFWMLVRLNESEWPHAVLGLFGSVLAGAVTPFLGLLLGYVSTLFYSPDFHHVQREVRKVLVYFVLLGIGSMIGYIIQEYFWNHVNENLAKRIRVAMLSAILSREIAWFDQDENGSNQLSTRLSSDASVARTVLGGVVSLLANTLTILAVTCTICFVLSWKMALVSVAVFPINCLVAIAERAFLKGNSGGIAAAHQKASTMAAEAIINIRTVAAFCAEGKVLSLFTKELSEAKKRSLSSAQISGFMFGSTKFFQFGSTALTLWYAAFLARHEQADAVHILDVFFTTSLVATVVGRAFGTVPDLMKSNHAVESILSVLSQNTKIHYDENTIPIAQKIVGTVEFKKVEFNYPTRPEVSVLKGFSLRIPAKTSMALVGPSGCGKSTIVALIERFYEPLHGKILIDGADSRSYNLRWLRRHIGLVQQEPALFGTTIYDNILYGNADATDAEVEAAARVANAHDFITALPDGYKTFVGERGAQLSGGQKQRVAIARAILKSPTILLLDEATSALDAESEKVVQEALDRLVGGRTVVAIAHRLSSIRNMDAIAVVQDGVVVELGTHSELLSKRSGAYCRLVALQNERVES